MSDSLHECIIYEQPLNERMRVFLRLEHMFERIEEQISLPGIGSSRIALETLIDIAVLVGRLEIKNELTKELDRLSNMLRSLAKDHRVDQRQLTPLLQRVSESIVALKEVEGSLGHSLRSNEFLGIIRQRNNAPAGTCNFYIPAFQYWLNRPIEERQYDLQGWLSCFHLAREGLKLCLQLVRESTDATLEQAHGGFFQKTLNSQRPCQLIRVALSKKMPYFTEISAGKHRFTMRFMRHEGDERRAVQITENVDFQLFCCFI